MRPPSAARLALLASALLASAAPAAAAPGWQLPAQHLDVVGGVSALVPDGTLAFVGETEGPSLVASVRPPSGNWQTTTLDSGGPRNIGAYAPSVLADPAGDLLAVWEAAVGTSPRPLKAAFRPAGGTWSPIQVPSADDASFRLVGSPNGTAFLAYAQGGTVEVSVRPPGSGDFPAPVAVATGGAPYASTAIAGNDAGDAVLVFNTADGNGQAYRRSGTTGAWSAAGTFTGMVPTVAIDPAGNAVAAGTIETPAGDSFTDTMALAYAPAGAAFGAVDESRTSSWTPVPPLGFTGAALEEPIALFDHADVAHVIYERESHDSDSTLREATLAPAVGAVFSDDTVIATITTAPVSPDIKYEAVPLADGSLVAVAQDGPRVTAFTRSVAGVWGSGTVIGCTSPFEWFGDLFTDGSQIGLATLIPGGAPQTGFELAQYRPDGGGTDCAATGGGSSGGGGSDDGGGGGGAPAGGGDSQSQAASTAPVIGSDISEIGPIRNVTPRFVVAGAPKVVGGKVTTGLVGQCPAAGPTCVVTGRGIVVGAGARAARATVVGRIAMRIAAGHSAFVRMRLTRAGKAVLRRHRSARFALTVVERGARTTTVHRTIVVRAPRRHHG